MSTGGSSTTGGTSHDGGSSNVAGTTSGGSPTGGAASVSGASNTGGTVSTGGNPTVGGVTSTGGNPITGGSSSLGGSASGGTSANSGGSSSIPVMCIITGKPIPGGANNPANICNWCQPAIATTDWTNVADGVDCGGGQLCIAGICQTGCHIGDAYFAMGSPNPDNPCQSCQPAQSGTSWANVPTAPCVQAISAGDSFACAIVNGAGRCWGSGALGSGTNLSSLVPVSVNGLDSGLTDISASTYSSGGSTACAIRNGATYCWGRDIGNGTGTGSDVPVAVAGLSSGVTSIANGGHGDCATMNGEAYCWGTFNQPTAVAGMSASVTAISVGNQHTCAIAGGQVYCWGNNDYGQLGYNPMLGGVLPLTLPNAISGLPSPVTAISANNLFNCAIANQTAYCWGDNVFGQLGDAPQPTFAPTQVQGLPLGVTAISAGASHTCAIIGPDVYCWGGGQPDSSPKPPPAKVDGLPGAATAISAGNSFTCAIVNGRAYCWGLNYYGTIGNGTTVDSPTPVLVQLP